MKKTNETRPALLLWVLALWLVFAGILMLVKFRAEGFISITPGGITGQRYYGSVAIFVIVVTLATGLGLTAKCICVWYRSKRGRR